MELWSNGVLECWERDFYEENEETRMRGYQQLVGLGRMRWIILGSPVTISAQVLLSYGKIRGASSWRRWIPCIEILPRAIVVARIREYLHQPQHHTLGSLGESVSANSPIFRSRHLPAEEKFRNPRRPFLTAGKPASFVSVEALETQARRRQLDRTAQSSRIQTQPYGIPEDKERKADGAREWGE